MRNALDSITAPFTAWIPDISAVPPRRQVTIGVIASVVLHLLAFLIMALLAGVVRKPADLAPATPQPEALELQVILPEQPQIMAASVAQEKQFIDSRGLAESKPGEDPLFETDKDMTAASEKPATGDLPLPSQDGRGKFDNVFETTKSSVGSVKEPPVIEITPAPPTPPSKAQPPVQQKPAPTQPAATPAPAATPPPKTAEKPDPAAVAKATLEKLREVETRRDQEIALAARQLPPLPAPVTQVERLDIQPPVQPAMPAPQQMAKLTKPAYQAEQEKSRVEGRITNRGKNAVDASATPLGKYKKQIIDAIGSRWLYYVNSQMDVLALGTAKVSFNVTHEGRVRNIRVESNTSNASFAGICERAIREAELTKPPAGSLDQMRDRQLEYVIPFTLF